MGKKPKNHAKYLEDILDEHFSLSEHMNALKQKLNRANGILAKLRYYLLANTLKRICYALFDSRMTCMSNLGSESQ